VRVHSVPFSTIASAAMDEKSTRDPFHRLISADEKIHEHDLQTVW